MHHDLIGTVFVYVAGLFLIYIEANSQELIQADALDQFIRIHQCAAGGIDQDHAVFHLFDRLKIDHMVRGIHQRAMQGDQVTLRQQGIQIHILHKIRKCRVLIYIISDHLHAKAAADPCHGRTDLTGSYDAGGLLIKVHATQPL